MNKNLVISVLLVLLAGLAACNSSNSTSDTTGQGNPFDSNAGLTQEMHFLIGTIKLENTNQAVSADQAAQLVPLWQALLSLETSGTAANEEIEAVIAQIQETMTDEQVAAITAMDLTRQSEIDTMQALGLSTNFASGTPMAVGTPGAPGDMGFPGDGGTMPSGNMPSGGAPSGGMLSYGPSGSMPSGGPQGSSGSGLDQSQIATLQARGTPKAMGSIDRVPQALLSALIDLLQKKITP
jgi:hypothetical protein